jgi:hypothetical protein
MDAVSVPSPGESRRSHAPGEESAQNHQQDALLDLQSLASLTGMEEPGINRAYRDLIALLLLGRRPETWRLRGSWRCSCA